eukprot:XP_001702175.1 predicted protein [Chlamydomonas reinhardtii]
MPSDDDGIGSQIVPVSQQPVTCRVSAVASVSYEVADEAVLRSLERPANNIVSLSPRRQPHFMAVKEPTSWVPSLLPGPSAEESSGLDFVDLVKTPRAEVQARLQDASTYLMLGCANGVLPRSSSSTATAPVNVRALTRFRNNVTRNLSPAIAVSCSEAMQAAKAATKRRVQELLEQQRAATGAIGGSSGAGPGAIASSAVSQVTCRFVVASASVEQPLETPLPALCVAGVAGEGAAAPVIVVAADVSAVSSPTEAAESAAQQQEAVAPSASHGAPSLSGDDLDALRLQRAEEHLAVALGKAPPARGALTKGAMDAVRGRLAWCNVVNVV